jgi:hypothetical protein
MWLGAEYRNRYFVGNVWGVKEGVEAMTPKICEACQRANELEEWIIQAHKDAHEMGAYKGQWAYNFLEWKAKQIKKRRENSCQS